MLYGSEVFKTGDSNSWSMFDVNNKDNKCLQQFRSNVFMLT